MRESIFLATHLFTLIHQSGRICSCYCVGLNIMMGDFCYVEEPRREKDIKFSTARSQHSKCF